MARVDNEYVRELLRQGAAEHDYSDEEERELIEGIQRALEEDDEAMRSRLVRTFPSRGRDDERISRLIRLKEALDKDDLGGARGQLFQAMYNDINSRLSVGDGANGLALSPDEWTQRLVALHKEPSLGNLADLIIHSYNGPLGDIESKTRPPEFLDYIDDLYDISGITDGGLEGSSSGDDSLEDYTEDGGENEGVELIDSDGNGKKETAVVTGGTKKELKANTRKALDKVESNETDAEELPEADLATMFSSEEDTPSDKDTKDVKREEVECVSDETMKNILTTLMDYRW